MPRNFGVSHHRNEFETVYRPTLLPALISFGLWAAIIVSVAAIWGVF